MEEMKLLGTSVGSITFGCTLVVFEFCFNFAHFCLLNYQVIFHLWPCILILLGIEMLLLPKDYKVCL